MSSHKVVFKSWGNFVDTSETGKSEIPASRRASLEPDKGFTGVENSQEAYKLAREGWKKGTIELNEMARPLFDHVSKMIQRVEVSHDVEGHSIDVARFVDGEPEAWLKFEEVIQESESGHKLIRIAFNISVSAGISKDVITRRGAAVSALVELLEYAGHRVELILCHAVSDSRNGEPLTECFIRLKEFDQNLDTAVLAFALAHPATLRVLTFSMQEQLPREVRNAIGVPGMYGIPADVSSDNRGDVYVARMLASDSQWGTPEQAEKWIVDRLKEQGVTIHVLTKI